MIDITHETLIPIREVPRHIPLRPNGKHLHVSAVYRWIQRGSKGLRLEAVRIGGTTYTSKEALQRFAEHLNLGNQGDSTTVIPTNVTHQRQIERARREVETILDTGRPRLRRRGDKSEPTPDSRP